MWFQKRVDVHQGCGYSAAVQRARLFLLLLSTKTECDANDRECVVNRRLLFQSLCTAKCSAGLDQKAVKTVFGEEPRDTDHALCEYSNSTREFGIFAR